MSERRSFSAGEARNLLRRARTATLGTLNADDGIPYASLVNVATDVRGCPLVLISTLAWHTRNLLADPRGSVMVAEVPEQGDALTGARVTVMGRFSKVDAREAGRRRSPTCHSDGCRSAWGRWVPSFRCDGQP